MRVIQNLSRLNMKEGDEMGYIVGRKYYKSQIQLFIAMYRHFTPLRITFLVFSIGALFVEYFIFFTQIMCLELSRPY